jgi:tellurite methyltransferase
MGQHRQHRGEEAERDVTRDVAASQTEHRGGEQTEKTEEERAEQSLSHCDLSMTHQFPGDPPSPFVVDWATLMATALPAPRRALDVAMGRGRHTRVLAQLGLRAFGVDVLYEAVRTARDRAAASGLAIGAWCGDLTMSPLPAHCVEMIVVARYLQRDLFAAIRDAVTPNGIVIYETFTVNQRALGFGQTSPDHLLQPGELRARFDGLDILFYEEVSAPEAVARLVARRSG